MKDPAGEVEQLRDELRRHEHLYYVLDQPAITDAEYDALMRRLGRLKTSTPNSHRPIHPRSGWAANRAKGSPKSGTARRC